MCSASASGDTVINKSTVCVQSDLNYNSLCGQCCGTCCRRVHVCLCVDHTTALDQVSVKVIFVDKRDEDVCLPLLRLVDPKEWTHYSHQRERLPWKLFGIYSLSRILDETRRHGVTILMRHFNNLPQQKRKKTEYVEIGDIRQMTHYNSKLVHGRLHSQWVLGWNYWNIFSALTLPSRHLRINMTHTFMWIHGIIPQN